MTLNMVRRSRVTPRLSAYQQVWGNFDSNRTPMEITGCKALVHLCPQESLAYSSRDVLGFYVEPSMHKFRNCAYYVPSSMDTQDSNTVHFYPRHTQMPET